MTMSTSNLMLDRHGDASLDAFHHVAVTGGLGFVGGHLVAALSRLGKRVTIVDIAAPGDQTLPADAELRRADLRRSDHVAAALHDADLVFHLAGNSSGTLSVDRPRFDFETNAQGTFNVCEALRTSSARLVYLSTAMVYGRPLRCPIDEDHPLQPFLPYGASKLSGELVVAAFQQALGLDAVTARAFTVYGPGEDPRRAGGEVSQFMRWHLNGLEIRATGDIDRKTRDFVHVEDLVSALVVIAERGRAGDTFNVGTGREVSLRSLATAIGDATGRMPRVTQDRSITEDTYRFVADVSKLRSLGYEPRKRLHEGLVELATHLGDSPELPAVATIFRPEQRTSKSEVLAC